MRIALALLALFLASCASQSHNVRLSAAQIAGTYCKGDGVGPGEELVLHGNGTFTSTLQGDLIVDPYSFYGTWSLQGDKITFHDLHMRAGSEPFHTYAITQRFKGHLVLLPGQYAKDHSVAYSLFYTGCLK